MTRLEKSDAQLDAEASVKDRPLIELIADHRALYHADLMLPRLHVSSGETAQDDDGPATGHADGWTGLPFSAPFLRFINWSKDRVEMGVRPTHPGRNAPWTTARFAQWAECRRSHIEHRGRDEWRGSLCYQLVSFNVCRFDPTTGLPFTFNDACLVLGVTPQRAGRTLRVALLYIEASMDRAVERQKERAQPLRSRILWRDGGERHHLPGLHAEDCPQCMGAA